MARSILDNPAQYDMLTSLQLLTLCINHKKLADRVLDTPLLYNKLTKVDLERIAGIDSKFALKILNTPVLCAKIDAGIVYNLSINDCINLEIALKIMSIPRLRNNLNPCDLVKLGKYNSIAQTILSTPALCNKLKVVEILELVNNRPGLFDELRHLPTLRSRRFPNTEKLTENSHVYFEIKKFAITLRNKNKDFAHQCPYHLRKLARAK